MRHVHMDADDDVIVYAIGGLPHTYVFTQQRDYGGVLETKPPPADSVLTAYTSLHRSHVDEAMAKVHSTGANRGAIIPQGVLLYWEWTPTAAGDPNLPEDHATRYSERLL